MKTLHTASEPLPECAGSVFDAAIKRIRAGRDRWHEQARLDVVSEGTEHSLTLAQWQRSLTGDDLAEWMRQLIRFLRPEDQSEIDLVLWECFHRLKGTPHRKSKMDRAVEKLMPNT